jgi:hypothetical protein
MWLWRSSMDASWNVGMFLIKEINTINWSR